MKKKPPLKSLPKIKDSTSYLYLEYGHLAQKTYGVVFSNDQYDIEIPIASLTSIMLGPGTTVTHGAVSTLAAYGCTLLWVGRDGIRFYANGMGETLKGYHLQLQAELSSDPVKRLKVIDKMYRYRFDDDLPETYSLEQVRGMEGVRVREAYQVWADNYGIEWNGRKYDRSNWHNADRPNRALSTANACLHAVCRAAILSVGYSPGLGFIHQGKQNSFVYDIADLYKVDITVPLAFATVAEEEKRIESEIRRRCRQGFRNIQLFKRIVNDIHTLLNTSDEQTIPLKFDPDLDPALPSPWWTPPAEEEEL